MKSFLPLMGKAMPPAGPPPGGGGTIGAKSARPFSGLAILTAISFRLISLVALLSLLSKDLGLKSFLPLMGKAMAGGGGNWLPGLDKKGLDCCCCG